MKHFGRRQLGGPNQLTDVRPYRTRVCWISTRPRPASDHLKGWGRLIHDTSHWVFQKRHPSFRPHDGGHAALEREMAAYASDKGWLQGALRPPVKVALPAADRDRAKLQRIEAGILRWTSKAKRAETALKKLRRQQKYYAAKCVDSV